MFKRMSLVMTIAVIVIILSSIVYNCCAQTTEDEALKKGVDLIRHDKFDEAIAEFNSVVATDPKSASAYYNLGFAYDKKDDFDKAILNFTKAIEIDPTLADAYYNRGFAYYRKGSFDNAIIDYNKVIEISPTSADAYYGLGLSYSKKGDLNKAIAEYTKAIKVRPNFALAYDARAVAYVTKKNYIGALADVNKAQSLGFRSRPIKRVPAASVDTKEKASDLPDSESYQEVRLMSPALKVAGIIFLLVSMLHLLRFIFKVRVTIGKFTVPIWFSVAAFIVTFLLSYWIFQNR